MPSGEQAQLDDERKRELHSVIQAHFKEWLLSSGNMRQVCSMCGTACCVHCVSWGDGAAGMCTASSTSAECRWDHAMQVYDLARMERDDPQREDGPSGSSNPPL